MAEAQPIFSFLPRWKEELVVTGPGGSFILDLPMGILSAYLPSEATWCEAAPAWARDLWPALHSDLEAWCAFNNARLYVEDNASVYPAD
jgi:hypothetical protein